MDPFDVCELLGIPFDRVGVTTFEGAAWDTPWDGKKMNGRLPCGKGQKYRNLFHEIGHWLVADDARRQYRTFGLGSSYDGLPGVNLVGGSGIALEEEVRASAVGILLHAAVGDPHYSWKHAESHSWFCQCGKNAWADLQKECPDSTRVALLSVGIELPKDKPKNWRPR